MTDEPGPAVVHITIDEAIERVGSGRFQRQMLTAAGLCFAADSMEVLLLSFLAVVVQSEWGLSQEATSSITASVFLGALLGTLLLGPLGDKIGRKPVFVLSAAIISVFGVLTAVAHNLTVLVIIRFVVGMGVGGLVIPFDCVAEFVPTSTRGKYLLYLGYFWTLGTILVPVLAYVSLGENTNGDGPGGRWRLFVLLCAIPCVLSTILATRWVPESPHWLVSQGRNDKALEVLKYAAKVNGHNVEEVFPPTLLIRPDEKPEVHSMKVLLQPEWRNLTLKLWGTWFGFAFLYYGTIILVTIVFAKNKEITAGMKAGSYEFDYAAIFAAASAELVGQTLVLLTIETWGRVRTQALSYLLGGISVFALAWFHAGGSKRGILLFFSFLGRMFMMGSSSTTWVVTAEILPTEIRNTGHSAANAMARLGGAFSPFVVSTAVPMRIIGIIMGAVSLVTCLLSWQLPETKGKALGTAHTGRQNSTAEDNTQPSVVMGEVAPDKTREII